jgi:hypothetical protein
MIPWLACIIAMLVFLGFGVAATFYTERLRTYWIRQCERHPDEIHWRIVGRRVRSDWYSIELRLIGILCLGTVILFVWGFLRPWL